MSGNLHEPEFSRAACGGDPRKLLNESDRGWQELEPVFISQGYRLGGRLAPDWIPSWWKEPGLTSVFQPDFQTTFNFDSIDAYRVTDGSSLSITRFSAQRRPNFIKTASLLNSIEDPRNRAIPLWDSFSHPSKPDIQFIVTPLMRSISDPQFDLVEEVIDCVEQLLQGLVFMHENRIFHGSISPFSLRMDNAMFPNGIHPHHHGLCPDGKTDATRIPRVQAGVKYYYTDFSNSFHIPPELPPFVRLQSIPWSSGPETMHGQPYNPFKADVFALGTVFKDVLYDRFSNTGFLKPLIDRMMVNNPNYRPSAEESYEAWRDIRAGMSRLHAAWRLHPRYIDEPLVITGILDGVSAAKTVVNWFMRS